MNSERLLRNWLLSIALIAAMAVAAPTVLAEEEAGLSKEELARKAQNPVANLISLPFQNNTNFDVGPGDHTQNILNIQPVYPVSLNEQWNLITRTIVPIINQPPMYPGADREFGLGDIQFTAFLSPVKSGGLIWGAGPIFQFPSATDDALGAEKWAAGPSAVVLTMNGPWVYGGLINNIWSFAGDSDRSHLNQMLIQPFINYNMDKGWYLTSAPIITANWKADSGNKWTVPVGGGIGKIIKAGKLPLNCSVSGYYNVETPRYGAEWQLRLQLQMLFPK